MINVLRIFEYDMTCDKCGANEVLHTGDGAFVHNISTAIKQAGFHRSGEQLLCSECWERERVRE